MKITSCKGEYEGDCESCVNWLDEFQPAIASVEIAGQSASLASDKDWPQAIRNALVDMSSDIWGGEQDWQKYLSHDQLADVIAKEGIE